MPTLITITKLADHCLLVVPSIDLIRSSAYDFYHQIQDRITIDPHRVIVIIDLSSIDYVDSVFWSRIISLVQRVEKIIFVGLTPPSVINFHSLGMAAICMLADNLEQAKRMAKVVPKHK